MVSNKAYSGGTLNEQSSMDHEERKQFVLSNTSKVTLANSQMPNLRAQTFKSMMEVTYQAEAPFSSIPPGSVNMIGSDQLKTNTFVEDEYAEEHYEALQEAGQNDEAESSILGSDQTETVQTRNQSEHNPDFECLDAPVDLGCSIKSSFG